MYSGPQRKYLRLRNYNYSKEGSYFITICTKQREDFFGEIIDGKMILNEYGKIAEKFWEEIILHYQNVGIDEFVIMPNHIHGIIIIFENENTKSVGNDYYHSKNIRNENIGNENIRSLQPQKVNLSNVIKGFKIGCTKEIRKKFEDFTFGWQKSFFDKIIRNDEQLEKTREYIINNPFKWEFDINNKINEELLLKKMKKNCEKYCRECRPAFPTI